MNISNIMIRYKETHSIEIKAKTDVFIWLLKRENIKEIRISRIYINK